MVVEVVNFDLFYFIICWVVLYIDNPCFKPSSEGMEGIDSIINLYLFAVLPLGQYSIGVSADVLVKFGRPSRVMNIDLGALNENDLAIDPFFRCVSDVNILSKVEL